MSQIFENNLEKIIFNWIDNVLIKKIPDDVVAFCFNLYDDGNYNWSMEIVGTESFDAEDADWACDEITDFDTRTNPLSWIDKVEWKDVLKKVTLILEKYIEKGKFSNILNSVNGVAVGFVDGDINIIYKGVK